MHFPCDLVLVLLSGVTSRNDCKRDKLIWNEDWVRSPRSSEDNGNGNSSDSDNDDEEDSNNKDLASSNSDWDESKDNVSDNEHCIYCKSIILLWTTNIKIPIKKHFASCHLQLMMAFTAATALFSTTCGATTMTPMVKVIPNKHLHVSEPNPSWFGNEGNPTFDPAWTNKNWLKSLFHFLFAKYNNPANQDFGVLRVMNDDLLVQP